VFRKRPLRYNLRLTVN